MEKSSYTPIEALLKHYDILQTQPYNKKRKTQLASSSTQAERTNVRNIEAILKQYLNNIWAPSVVVITSRFYSSKPDSTPARRRLGGFNDEAS